MSPMDHNPYAPPVADRGEVRPRSELETVGGMTVAQAKVIRRAHLRHEARLRLVGAVMLLGAVYVCLAIVVTSLGFKAALGAANPVAAKALFFMGGLLLGQLLLVLGVTNMVGGCALRRLDPNYHALYTALACMWVLSTSPLSLFGLWALYLLRSRAGKIVLSHDYVEARRLTPDLHVSSNGETWLAFLILVLGAAFAIYAL